MQRIRSGAPSLSFYRFRESSYQGRWAIVDLGGKHGRVRTVPMPSWAKDTLDGWERVMQASLQMDKLDIASLHFSPRGEAKYVIGPSGRGASRAEEKGACWRACQIASFTPRFTGRQTFLLERTSPPPMGFTKHETRITNHGLFPACFDRRVVRNAG